jgi:predicted naringenin-chalcone synthase
MSVYIHAIETLVSDVPGTQDEFRDFIKKYVLDPNDRLTRMIVQRLYSNSGIETRQSFLREVYRHLDDGYNLFYDQDNDVTKTPTTRERNEVYQIEARKAVQTVAERIVTKNGWNPDEITHVITVSCTGFYSPGPDMDVVNHLGLKRTTAKYHLGFMGCHAVYPAFQLAQQICEANPNAKVIVVSIEMCTLHLKFDTSVDSILSASLFADGAAAALISAEKPQTEHFYEMHTLKTISAPVGTKDLLWNVGDTGFDIVLSTEVPKIIGKHIPELIQDLFSEIPITPDEVDVWALHPGGRAIVDEFQKAMNVVPEKITYSREVLRKYGNMSSATILFVMKEWLGNAKGNVVGVTFGPGLTVETGHFTLH